ncbi:MAG TPA: allantoinase AllB [Propionibacteriaceae bacterium]|nr:allantoinase AllB [Propionibacteriaceae bacterium]HBY22179.1 allantoinase AllB [Propionibacteriaceae bacterium]
MERVVRARKAVLPEGVRAVSVAIEGGRIAAISEYEDDHGCADIVELTDDEVLLPGLIDIHVHVNEPGRTEWEGFLTATKAAAAGGITTLVDMPLNSSPTTVSLDALNLKREVAADKIRMDVGFWGGAVPGNIPEIKPMWEAGVFGFKCFLGDSGLPEFPFLSPEELREAMAEIASFGGLLIVHAEDAGVLDESPAADGPNFGVFMNSHPAKAEVVAVRNVIEAVRATGCRTHILHLAASETLPDIKAAKAEGLPITAETCPHYLTFEAEEIPDGATQYKCCPPLRDHDNRLALWQGLIDGTIDCIASDHSPCTVDLKKMETGDFGKAWGGIASVQLGLPAVWTQAKAMGIPLTDVVRWMGSAPSDLVGLPRKGRLQVGADADLVIFAPEETFVVDKDRLFHKNPVTPYHGRTLSGTVHATWLAGTPLDLEDTPRGAELTRN